MNVCDNIFNMTNIKRNKPEKKISSLLRAIAQPTRLRILAAIGAEEACVCHLEARLGLRQAYISQHLMALRKARVLRTRRDGRFIYYRLQDERLLDFIHQAGVLAGISDAEFNRMGQGSTQTACCCPHCSGESSDIGFIPIVETGDV